MLQRVPRLASPEIYRLSDGRRARAMSARLTKALMVPVAIVGFEALTGMPRPLRLLVILLLASITMGLLQQIRGECCVGFCRGADGGLSKARAGPLREWCAIVLVLIGIPAVVCLLGILPPRAVPSTARLVAQILAFACTAVLLLAAATWLGGTLETATRSRATDIWPAVAIATGGTLIVFCGATGAYVLLLGASVEELIFRAAAPCSLHLLLEGTLRSRWAGVVAVLSAQLVFATCHFVLRGHIGAFGPDLPIVRLFAAGTFLAIVYEGCGLPVAALLHFLSNELIHIGANRLSDAPSSGVVLVGAAIGCAQVVLLYYLDCRQRVPRT